MGFNLLDEAQRLFSMAVGATTSKEADIHYIINMVDEFNLRITRLREENSTGFHKISGFDRILDELEE
jgi:recombinational DNA repair protein RecR